MDEKIRGLLEKQGYRIVGNHSAVKVCHWTKEKLMRNRACYKSKFYGIASHRCLQMTPSVAWCQHRCVFCWRPIEHTLGNQMDFEVDEPSFIVEKAIEKQRTLLSSYWGEKIDRKLVEEAHKPRHAAISLAGEPTTYPYIDELINEFHKRSFTTFLVTNGQNPERLERVRPTQLYLSLIAYDRELYKKINAPQLKDGWGRLNRSIDIFRNHSSKKVVRITLVRGYNLEHPEKFSKLVERANPDYIEPKGYVHVGYSRKRLERSHMPTFEEVYEFARVLGSEVSYKIKDYAKDSKVVLLVKA
ncbi:MAG: 4-demethylwyosine synthase TYW1 [Methanobacteriota archaeon]